MYFFLTDTCIGIIKSSGVRKFCPNNKFPDKSSAGLTRCDCKSRGAKRNLILFNICVVVAAIVSRSLASMLCIKY